MASPVFGQINENERPIYIKAGKLFDSKNGRFLLNQTIGVKNNKIIGVGQDIPISPDDEIIDLSDYTVLPGLIDGHTHLLSLETVTDKHPMADKLLFEGNALRVLRASKRAKSWLDNGFTSIRDLGDSGLFLDVALKRAINEGTIIGPRMFVSGPIIASEGGQVPGLLREKRNVISDEYTIIKNVDDAINAVREHVTYGVDLIKICANNSPNVTSLTIDEMRAIVKMAHRYNKKVTAHATNDQSVWEAVTAGVDGIEHGYQISDSTLNLMSKKNVALIPTDFPKSLFYKYQKMSGFHTIWEKAYLNYHERLKDRLQRAIAQGVTILAGSDNYIQFDVPQGEAAKHVLVAYLEEGMSPVEILRSATYLSAKFMRMEDSIGIVKQGAFADLIAVKGDLETDFSDAIFNAPFIMKNGTIYKYD